MKDVTHGFRKNRKILQKLVYVHVITVNLYTFQVTSTASSSPLYQMNLIPYALWLFINLGCVFRDVLLMSVSEGKKYWDIRLWG